MTVRQNTAEGGTDGTTITVANTGGTSGTAFSATTGGTTAATFTASFHATGSFGYSSAAASGSTSITQWTGLSGTEMSARFSFMVPSLPAATTEMVHLRTAGGAVFRFILTTGGKLAFNDASNTTWKTSTSSITTGTWYDIVMRALPSGSTTTGTLQWGYYLSSTPTTLIEGTIDTAANAGTTTPLTEMRWGKLTTSTATNNFYFDNLVVNDAPSGTVPGPVVSAPPTLNQTNGTVYDVDARTSTAGSGGALSYTAAYVSGPTLTFSQPATGYFVFTQDSTTSAVYTITVNETGGGTASTNVTIPHVGATDVTGYAQELYFDGTSLI